jgi:hypothetical protein
VGKQALVFGLCVALVGCTRVVDPPQALPGVPVAPIPAGQVADLLSKNVEEQDGNLFVAVEPARCSGVAQEVDAPFIFDHNPAAHDGGHWVQPGSPQVHVEEIVGVFRANFDARKALADARRTLESCQGVTFTVTSMTDRSYDFQLLPPRDSGSPDIVLWSFTSRDWACDNAFVAAHNAAIEITTCAEVNGYDVTTLADEALKRIEALANTVA